MIPRVAIGPSPAPFAARAVAAGGGSVVDVTDHPDALVWLDAHDPTGITDALAVAPGIGWVQLPMAGVERVVDRGVLDHERVWTCAKGSYAEPVAEHALALVLAGLRHLPERVAARSWGAPAGTSLCGQRVTILGGGGIAVALLRTARSLPGGDDGGATTVRPGARRLGHGRGLRPR